MTRSNRKRRKRNKKNKRINNSNNQSRDNDEEKCDHNQNAKYMPKCTICKNNQSISCKHLKMKDALYAQNIQDMENELAALQIQSKYYEQQLDDAKKEEKCETYAQITKDNFLPLCLRNCLNKDSKINLFKDCNAINPNINELFGKYNRLFFDNALKSVKLKWNKKETSNAGCCMYWSDSRKRHCVIELSCLLLQYRPTKDMIETLIHEMIHAYLFIKRIDDESGHGERFLTIMDTINHICSPCNLQITVEHGYHDALKMAKPEIWQCDGICQNIISRSKGKPPGKHEKWWEEHQFACGGTFRIIIDKKTTQKNKKQQKRRVACPNCARSIKISMINEHLDKCVDIN